MAQARLDHRLPAAADPRFGVTAEQIAAVDTDVAAQIEEIARFAEQSPWPTPDEVAVDMFA